MPDQTTASLPENAYVTPADIAEMHAALKALEAAWWRAVGEPQQPSDTDLATYGHTAICASPSGWTCDCANGRRS